MKILIQWTQQNPGDWEEIDVTPTGAGKNRWRNLPSKPVPTGGEVIDNSPGWIFDINVQGVLFANNDHYAVEPLLINGEEALRVTVWNDDPDEWSGQFNAQVWTLLPPAPDPRYGGQLNTRQQMIAYDQRDPSPYLGQITTVGPVEVHPWSEFVPPASQITRHGIWVSDPQATTHRDLRQRRSWREWTG